MIWDVEAAVNDRPQGAEFIVAGYLNVDLGRTEGGGQDEEIAVVVETTRLEDLLVHFTL